MPAQLLAAYADHFALIAQEIVPVPEPLVLFVVVHRV